MARAKRTDRAEARRRYRAQLAERAAAEASEGPDEAAAPSGPSGRRAPATEAQPSARTAAGGIAYAFRAAIHPANIREDVAYLPRLLRHPSVWGPIAVSAGIAALTVYTGGRDGVSIALLPFFVWPPPQIGALFIAGFFAPRASYLAGGIVGLAISFVVAAAVAAAPTSVTTSPGQTSASPSTSVAPSAAAAASASAAGSPAVSTTPGAGSSAASPVPSASPQPSPAASPSAGTGTGTQTTDRLTPDQALIIGLGISPAAGVLLGSFSAWYRRFLRLANPNRGRPPVRRQQRRR